MPNKMHRRSQRKKAIAVLEKKQLKFVKNLGTGYFGDVIAVQGPEEVDKTAVKIIRADMTWKMEKTHWKEWDHPNVLPLLDYVPCDGFDLFMMPLHPKVMHKMLKDKKFRSSPAAFDSVKSWMRDILSGLAYLHEKQICHLDIKRDNVLITASNSAVLSDYSCINTTTKPVSRHGLMTKYFPPEAWRERKGTYQDVEGIPFDIWTFGLLVLNVLTGDYWYKKKLGQTKYLRFWHEDAYPHLFKALQPEFFGSLVHRAFPGATVSKTEVLRALNQIESCLRYYPEDRPQASALLDHSWVFGNKVLLPDLMWTHFMHRGSDFLRKDDNVCPTANSADFSVESQSLRAGDAPNEANIGSLDENLPSRAQEAVEYEDISKVDNIFTTEDFADFSVFENNNYSSWEGTQDPSLRPELATVPSLPFAENDGGSESILQEVKELLGDILATLDSDSLTKQDIEEGRVDEPDTAGFKSADEPSPFENFADFSVFETDFDHCGNVSPTTDMQATPGSLNDDVSPGVEKAPIQGFDSSKKKKSFITRVRGWFRKTFKSQRHN